MIAAPIWAASHAFPEGQGFIGQRAQAGYMVILSLILRPTLMLFGFFASMTLLIAMGKVIMALFLPFMSGMLGDTAAGIASFLALGTIFALLLVQITQRCFSLIHEIPDKVLRYIGGGAENLGEAQGEQAGRQMFAGAISRPENSA